MIRRLPTTFALLVLALGTPLLSPELAGATVNAVTAVDALQQRPGARGRPSPQSREEQGGDEDGGGPPERRGPQYSDVIPDDAVTKPGMFDVHEVDDDVFFEIPQEELGKEMILIKRTVETTMQDPSQFFPSGPRIVVQWERDDDRIILRQKNYQLIADTSAAVSRVVEGFRRGPILAFFDIALHARAPPGG